MITLTQFQKQTMGEFYNIPATKVVYNKKYRNTLWKRTRAREIIDMTEISLKCPALAHQINKSYLTNSNIQSAVFSECVYAQTYANMLNLDKFINCYENKFPVSEAVISLLNSHSIKPRYAYFDKNMTRILIQAGSCNSIDCALINISTLDIVTIEFKEPGAKTSEPDLPKYEEDGKLKITEKFLKEYPQFEEMLREQKNLNFFELIGKNEHNFSAESVNIAVSKNYTKKYADVVCTEDSQGNLVMLPINQISIWAKVAGEIRPAGRNAYKVWTPKALNKFLIEKGAKIKNGEVEISLNQLKPRFQRGGNKKISGYKINPIFFVYINKSMRNKEYLEFNLDDVLQLNPTIAGKVSFKGIKYSSIKDYYYNQNTLK